MTDPVQFAIDFVFVPGSLDPGVASRVLASAEGNSTWGFGGWMGYRIQEAGERSRIERSIPEELSRVVAGDTWSVHVSRVRPFTWSEEISFAHFLDLLIVRLAVWLPLSRQEEFFEHLCELLQPRHAQYLPNYDEAGGGQDVTLEKALQRDYDLYRIPEDDLKTIRARSVAPLLPKLVPPTMGRSCGENRPERLGWLNYWHEEVAGELGFPDSDKDARILPLCYRTASGAWIVKLTEESLDMARPEHVEAIAWAYWRFDKIGKRMQPTARKVKPRVKRSESDAATALGLKVFVLRERDEHGKWWDSATKPIQAATVEDALRIHFSRTAHGRLPKKSETLSELRDAYDGIAAEVGLTPSTQMEMVEAERGSSQSS